MEFTSEQFFLSTAESQKNYFTGQPETLPPLNPTANILPGKYRVIDGELYRIVTGIPPTCSDQDIARWC